MLLSVHRRSDEHTSILSSVDNMCIDDVLRGKPMCCELSEKKKKYKIV